jgi:hypothetical protein
LEPPKWAGPKSRVACAGRISARIGREIGNTILFYFLYKKGYSRFHWRNHIGQSFTSLTLGQRRDTPDSHAAKHPLPKGNLLQTKFINFQQPDNNSLYIILILYPLRLKIYVHAPPSRFKTSQTAPRDHSLASTRRPFDRHMGPTNARTHMSSTDRSPKPNL